MFNLQVTLSQLLCRKSSYQQIYPLIVTLRFGSIKFDIKVNKNEQTTIGGKRIVLDISAQQLQQMFNKYALAMFIENQNGKFFSIISLQKITFQDIISGQEVYFYNDFQEIIYSTNFSINFTTFKNPKLPNKQIIQNHKTFKQHFTKPAIPTKTDSKAKTLSSFLYSQRQNKKLASTSNNVNKKKVTGDNQNIKNSRKAAQNNNWKKKPIKQPQFYNTQPIHQVQVRYDENEYLDEDTNPPAMQFTNTQQIPLKGMMTLKNQLNQLNLTAPQNFKLKSGYENRNQSIKTHNKIIQKITNKIQDNDQRQKLIKTFEIKQNAYEKLVNRQDLKKKAKQQMQGYKGGSNIKIPIVKDGKCQFVQIAHLTEEQISKYAKQQKQLQEEEQRKRTMQKQLLTRQKQNQILKKQLQQKQRLLLKQQQQSKKQMLQLLQAKKNIQQQKPVQKNSYPNSKIINQPLSQQSEIDIQEQDYQPNQLENQENQENYYESDFQQISMTSGLKKSKLSIKQRKKGQQSQSFNDSYDPDFQSYSQSLVGSHQKLSMSQISQSLRDSFSRKR